jgi:16S rRNA (uracil1498-N3)-methyltransferase
LQRLTITPTQIHADRLVLTPEQDRYLMRVLRLQYGDRFQAIDGTGKLYLAEIAIDNSQSSAAGTARIIEVITTTSNPELSSPITLICALPKGNNFDDIVRACTELGVTSILPAISDRTLLNPSPHKLLRWRKIAQEAAEQSERLSIPTIAEPQSLLAIFSQLPDRSYRYCCEARGEHPHLLAQLQATDRSELPIIVAIGPEGGWTHGEIELATQHDFHLVSLGQHILRTITAPIVALSIVTAATFPNTRPQVLI